jgi:glycine betaine/proline transport system permease protein
MSFELPKIPLGKGIEWVIDFFADNFSGLTNLIATVIEWCVEVLTTVLLFPPAPLMILIIAGITWGLTAKLKLGIGTLLGMAFIWNLGLWVPTMQTLALVCVATLVAIFIGIPTGILSALSNTAHRIIFPILDFMQTLPAFVYLIPAIPFFGLGATSALFSTVIFAMPPAIRLTALGIEQVPAELVEAADAFGSTTWQKLIKLQLPIAATTIRAGVNQTILLSLSMVVIAAMIGAEGLGSEVWKAIQRLQPGMGFEAGISIVIIAIVLDRIMQNLRGRTYGASS